MIIIKIIFQSLTGISGLVALLLDYKWHDKKKKIFKLWRNILILSTIISLFLGIFITINDENTKIEEIAGLKTALDSTQNTLEYIKSTGDTLKFQIKPILDLAKLKYPNLSTRDALDSLKIRISTLDSSFFITTKEIENLNSKAKKLEKRIKIISAIELRVFVDEVTADSPLSDKETSAGIGSVIGLFDKKEQRYRFVTDYQFSEQQISNNTHRVSFIYKPEDPDQILGKRIDILSEMIIFACNYSEIPEIFGKPNYNKTYFLTCILYLNGVKISMFQNYKLENGRMFHGQINIPIDRKFSKIESIYNEHIEKEIN